MLNMMLITGEQGIITFLVLAGIGGFFFWYLKKDKTTNDPFSKS